MKLEQNEKNIIFSNTQIPDIFFSEFLSQMPGDYVKIYMYLLFLAKYNSDVKINDLANKLALPVNIINEGINYLESNKMILRKAQGYVIIELQERLLNELYKPNISTTPEKIEQNAQNQKRVKLIEYLNNRYFQGVMGLTWYNDINVWTDQFGFDDQVLITLFDYCFKKSALHRNYVQTVAEAWHLNNIKTLDDLDNYYLKQEKFKKIGKSVAKKLNRFNGLTEYEEAYLHKWIEEYNYGMDVIEIALKRTTFKANVSFEYLNNIIKDWHERNLKTPAEIIEFIEQRKQQNKNTKELTKQVKKESFEQREYTNLSFLYANQDDGGEAVS